MVYLIKPEIKFNYWFESLSIFVKKPDYNLRKQPCNILQNIGIQGKWYDFQYVFFSSLSELIGNRRVKILSLIFCAVWKQMMIGVDALLFEFFSVNLVLSLPTKKKHIHTRIKLRILFGDFKSY